MPPTPLFPLRPLPAADLRALIRQAKLEDFPTAFQPTSIDLLDFDPGWLPSLAHVRQHTGASTLLQVLDQIVADHPATRFKPPHRESLTWAIQVCHGLEEARRLVLRQQPTALRYRMPEFHLRQWLLLAGLGKLGELRPVDLGLPGRAHHLQEDLLHLITGEYRGAAREMDTFTRDLLELLYALAARRVRDQVAVPALKDPTPAMQRLHTALTLARIDALAAGVTGYSMHLSGAWTYDERRPAWVMPQATWQFRQLQVPLGELRVVLDTDHDDRLTARVELSPTLAPVVRLLAGASALSRLLLSELFLADDARREQLERTLTPNPWRRVLSELSAAQQVFAPPKEPVHLGWRVRLSGYGVDEVEAVRVTTLSRGGVRLATIGLEEAQGLALADAEERERVVIWSARSTGAPDRWYPLLQRLVGHPRVYVVKPGESASSWLGPLPVRLRRLRLKLSADGEQVVLGLPPGNPSWLALRLLQGPLDTWEARLSPDQAALDLIRLPAPLQGVLRALGRAEGRFPREALPDLLSFVPTLARECDVEVDESVATGRVEADRRLHLRLERQGSGLRVDASVVAIPGGPAWAPGLGPDVIYASEGQGLLSARRDRAAEQAAWERLATRLAPGAQNDDGVLQIESLETALTAIAALRNAQDVSVTWTGRQVRLHRAAAGNLRLRLRRRSNWFGVAGELWLEAGVVRVEDALKALRAGAVFVPMRDGEWVELESDLRAALQAMSRALPADEDGGALAGPLHAPLLAELHQQGARVDGLEAWSELVGRVEEAAALQPEPPPDLPLRPYQVEGFRWMCRLTHWGAGAVLADDMGLGKTLQAIAWLRHHAGHGPSLVVCPTSVCSNWLAELQRFAPDLDRRPPGADLGPGSVVVLSFTAATRAADALREIAWANLVIDEAHAIKNAATQRARAITGLPALRRLALTGTPIENHAGELWAVLSAVSPGLLGSQEAFRERFLTAIERDNDPAARQALARLIRPFVLRRLKREVATELPPRTDILVPVTLTAGERAFYHGLRESALTGIGDTDSPQARVHVLAALTRLRRAACDPRLIDPELALPSSKLAVLDALLDDLLEAGHRVLVFSQFTGLLDAVRHRLDARGVAHRDLDGSMPSARRATEIASFQAGEAPVFLLSLKAGGVGLNLTTADTVIHLDPWWNPAIEDQATDRAHRIGQTLPVTVYRLVAKGTVEEKILALHDEKRELAQSLLEGTGASARLETAELLELLWEASSARQEEDTEDEVSVSPDSPSPM